MRVHMEQQGDTAGAGRSKEALQRWLRANTFTPQWLTSTWGQHPATGYLAALALQCVATAGTLLLFGLFPGLAVSSALLLLTIALIALNWGAGPSLLATLAGAALLEEAPTPPRFIWMRPTASDGASLLLFLAVGVTLSVLASHSERRRRTAHTVLQHLQVLQAITETALIHPGLDELLRQMLVRVTHALAVDNTAILLLDDVHQDLVVHLAHGPEEGAAGRVRVPLGQGIAGRIAATRAPLIVDDVSTAEAVNPFLRAHIRSLMGVPLLVEGRFLGVLHVGTLQPRHFTPEDLRILRLVADRLALVMDHAQMHLAEQAARTEAVVRASEIEAVVEAMADAVFVYDAEGRIRRVNAAARGLFAFAADPDYPARPLAERLALTNTRDDQGQPLTAEQWPQLRVLRGEVFTGAQATDVLIRTLDGRDVRVNVSGAPVRNAAGAIVGGVLVLRDVTERRAFERRTHETLDALLAMARTLVLPAEESAGAPAPGAGRSRVGLRLAELTRNVLGCRRVALTSFDLQRGVQHPVAMAGLTPEQEQAWWATVEGAPIHDPRRLADPDLVARFFAGEVVILDMARPPFRDQPNPFGISAVLIAPLRLGDAIMGSLFLDYGGADHAFTAEEKTLAAAVAQLAALALERDRLQKEREEARATALALRESNQRMDDFLSIASHELKTPLTSIRGNVQLVRFRLDQAAGSENRTAGAVDETLTPLDTLLQRTETQIERQTRLIDDLLDLSRIQTGHLELHLETVDLGALVRECVDEQRLAWPARTATLDLPPTPLTVRADADRIAQVLNNYVSNAFKYSAADRAVAISLHLEVGTATVRVRDEGPGLTAEQQQDVWDRYRRVAGVAVRDDTRAPGGGLGLGLYISRMLVEQHGGQVGVESTPGQGATFWFTLPLTQPGQRFSSVH